jgi:hypothetical protein
MVPDIRKSRSVKRDFVSVLFAVDQTHAVPLFSVPKKKPKKKHAKF